ncbi:MAG: LemA family protein [Deltaproteobacteria bacterium]|nr:LemA family protein [Deltaproteobacteria bacterium]
MKSKALVVTLVVLGSFLLAGIMLVMWGVGIYNGLVASNEQVNSHWSQVLNQYQRRIDLIPNLVETVKGYASHEKQTLENVVNARARVGQLTVTPEVLQNPQALRNFERAQGELSSALSRLMAIAENYPNLKANENFLQLQAQLEGTENRIAVERRRFNESVQYFNTRVRTFPHTLIARIGGFPPKAYFEAQPGAETPPKVKF